MTPKEACLQVFNPKVGSARDGWTAYENFFVSGEGTGLTAKHRLNTVLASKLVPELVPAAFAQLSSK